MDKPSSDLITLAMELQALEAETFEIQDFVEVNNLNVAKSPGSCSTCSTCSTSSSCA